jgi:putative oxidoreductase
MSAVRETRGVAITRAVLRLMLGVTFVAHGMRHARTLDGTARWFASIGFRQAKLQARTSAMVEIASGTALLAGAATPSRHPRWSAR